MDRKRGVDDGRGGGGFLLGGRTSLRLALHRHVSGWLKMGVVDVVPRCFVV